MKTLQKCWIIKKALANGEGLPTLYDGHCGGYQKSKSDDEPCEPCKRCKLNCFYEGGEDK